MTYIRNYIHQDSNGYWHVALWVERANQYQAPLRHEVKKLTGCSQAFASRLSGLSGHHVYKHRSSAARRVRQIWDELL